MPEGTFRDHFSAHAAGYAAARPAYPPELFAWLATRSPARDLAWDCATGSGQAAVGLAAHFGRVMATDASPQQLRHAAAHPRIAYAVALAEEPPAGRATVDLVTAAQAAHWFELPRFYAAVREVLRPGGLLAIWCYGLFTIDAAVDAAVAELYTEVLGDWWPPERRLVDEGYRTLEFPFEEIAVPAFEIRRSWTLDQTLAYLRTWSAVQRYLRGEGRDPVEAAAGRLAGLWGRAGRREVRWPLHFRAGRRET